MNDRRVVRHPKVLWLRTLRGVMLCLPDSDESRILTEPGDLIWTLLRQPMLISEVGAILTANFDGDPLDVEVDVAALVAELILLGAVVEVD